MRPEAAAGLARVCDEVTGAGPCPNQVCGGPAGAVPTPDPDTVSDSPATVVFPWSCKDEPGWTTVPAVVAPSARLLATVSTPPGRLPGLPKWLLRVPPSLRVVATARVPPVVEPTPICGTLTPFSPPP